MHLSSEQPKARSRVTNAITVVRAGDDTRPAYGGRSEVDGEQLHFVSVRDGLVIQGTINELREFIGELGLAVAEVEHDELREKVREGRRRAAEMERRLA